MMMQISIKSFLFLLRAIIACFLPSVLARKNMILCIHLSCFKSILKCSFIVLLLLIVLSFIDLRYKARSRVKKNVYVVIRPFFYVLFCTKLSFLADYKLILCEIRASP